ncbi:J domain-containing protein [Glaciecola sp. XM2]|jgi:hypothetical protein|nr:J domain-containing protein [Glaciecola sp. XM2]
MQTQFADGISEYDLISVLQKPPYALFDEDALRDSITLFETHFVLFNALYQLRVQWRTEGIGELIIGPTNIYLSDIAIAARGIELDDPLARYYLDWANLHDTTPEDVENLLDSFWQKMGATHSLNSFSQQDIQDALNCLAFESLEGLTLLKLKQQYRRLQHLNHPDKGGCTEQSKALTHAYSQLRKYMLNNDNSAS